MPSRKHNVGFTMVELMVTLAVMVILTALAVPSFTDFFQRYRLRGAADSVVSVVSNARAEAVKTDLDVNVSFTGSGTAWCVGANSATVPTGGALAGTASACTCTDATKCLVSGQRLVAESAGSGGVSVGTLPTAFVFDSKMGTLVPLGDRRVTFTSPNGKYDVRAEINALGQARLCVPSGKPMMSGVASC